MKSQAEKIIQILEENNYEAYFIGGSVRNTLHSLAHGEKLPIKDYDIVTNASYQQVKELFDHVESRGASFHVAVVKIDGYEFEVAQYRGEVYPKGGSLRPDIVFSVDTLEEDVSRRDFTINGIAQTRDNEIIDHVNGVRDIRLKCIQTIGDPNERFAEDPLRIMRAFRFMAQLDYSIEGKTAVGMIKNYDKLSKIPHERMKEEFHKLLRADYTIAAFQKMRSMRFHKQNFFNSIEEKEVRLLRGSLDLQKQYFNKMLLKLDQYDRKNADISELYYILYYYKNYEFVKKELQNMMFLNENEIERTVMLLKHSNITYLQTSLCLYNLVRDIGEQRGMKYLLSLLESYKKLHDVDFSKIEKMMEKPLFKYQLPFNGNDVLELGKKYDMKPGKWVGEVMDKAQKNSIFGIEYELEELVRGVLND